MDILALTTNFPPQIGGMQKNAYEITKRLDDDHNVRVIWIDDSKKEFSGNLDVKKESTSNNIISEFSILSQANLLRKEIKQFEPDLIYGNNIEFGYALLLIPNSRDLPIVLRNPSSAFLNEYYSEKSITRLKLRLAAIRPDAIITPSEELKKATGNITDTDVVKISNAVDTEKFSPKAKGDKEHFKSLEDKFIVMTTRRFAPKNGMKYLAKSIEKTPDDINFVMFGEGQEYSNIKSWINSRGLKERVRMPGNIPHHKLPAYYAAADVSVLPSLREAICFSGIESFSCGTPVIGTNTGGITELVDDGKNGLIVPKKDPESIASAIKQLHDDDNTKAIMGENARRKAINEYSWESVYQKYLDVIENAYK